MQNMRGEKNGTIEQDGVTHLPSECFKVQADHRALRTKNERGALGRVGVYAMHRASQPTGAHEQLTFASML